MVDVYPGDIFDRLLLNGYRAEVWMQEGVTPAMVSTSWSAPTPMVRTPMGPLCHGR